MSLYKAIDHEFIYEFESTNVSDDIVTVTVSEGESTNFKFRVKSRFLRVAIQVRVLIVTQQFK